MNPGYPGYPGHPGYPYYRAPIAAPVVPYLDPHVLFGPYTPLAEAAVDRLAQDLADCVNKVGKDKEYEHFKAKFILLDVSFEDRQRAVTKKIDGSAVLFLACHQDLVRFVDYFLEECGADVEQKGVYWDPVEGTKHEITPLWVSALLGHVEVLKLLLKHGADVNATSDNGNTPLRSACFQSHLEVVKLLVGHGADIHHVNRNGGTCLMNAVTSVDICRFLIEKNVAVNLRDEYGSSALLYAAQHGRAATVKLLLEHGADINVKNIAGDDPYRMACLSCSPPVLEVLMQHSTPSVQCQIECHELMGANFVDELGDLDEGLKEWRSAMLMRQHNNMMLSPDDLRSPRPAYLHHTEATTLEQLAELVDSPDRLYMQALVLRERVLGPEHKDTIFGVVCRGNAYYTNWDDMQPQRCAELWKYAFELRFNKYERIHHEGMYTLQALCKLYIEMNEQYVHKIADAHPVRFKDVWSVYNIVCDEAEAVFLSSKENVSHAMTKEDFNMMVQLLLHLICLLDEITTGPDILDFWRRLFRLVEKKITLMDDGRTLLHLALDKTAKVIDEDEYSPLPNERVVKLLLGCGADVNATDGDGNTPLHFALRDARKGDILNAQEKSTTTSITKELLSRGAHLDARNKFRHLACAGLRILPIKMKTPVHYLTLKCLAAAAVKAHRIPYKGQVPVNLYEYIELH